MDKGTTKSKKIFAVMTFIVSFVASYFAVQYFTNGNRDYSRLLETSEEMNKSFPTKVDNDTRLDSTNVKEQPLTLNYYYTIVTVDKDSLAVDLHDVVKQMRKVTQGNLDNSPQMADFRKADVSLKYIYYDKKGAFLVDYDIKPTKK